MPNIEIQINTLPQPLHQPAEGFVVGAPNQAEPLAVNLFNQVGIEVEVGPSPDIERHLLEIILPGSRESLVVETSLTLNNKGNLVLTDETRRKARDMADHILAATGHDYNLARQFLNEFKQERNRLKSDFRNNQTIDETYKQTPQYQTEVLLQRLASSLNLKLRHEEKKAVSFVNPQILVRPAQNAETRTPAPVYNPEAISYTPVYRPTEHVSKQPEVVHANKPQTIKARPPLRRAQSNYQTETIVKPKQGLFSRFKNFIRSTIEKVRSYFVQPENKPYQIAQYRNYQKANQPAALSLPEFKIPPQVKQQAKQIAQKAAVTVKNEARRLVSNAVPGLVGVSAASLAVTMAGNLDGYAPFFGRPELNNIGVQLGVNALALGVLGAATLGWEKDFKKGLRLLPKKVAQYCFTAAAQSAIMSFMR